MTVPSLLESQSPFSNIACAILFTTGSVIGLGFVSAIAMWLILTVGFPYQTNGSLVTSGAGVNARSSHVNAVELNRAFDPRK